MNKDHTYRIAFARYPAVRMLVCFILGILMGKYVEVSIGWALATVSGFIILLIFLEIRQRYSLNPNQISTTILVYLLILTGMGWYVYSSSVFISPAEKKLKEWSQNSVWEEARFYGRVMDLSLGENRYTLTIQVDSVEWIETLTVPQSFQMHARRTSAQKGKSVNVRPELGDYIGFVGTIYPIKDPRIPGQFNYKSYLSSENIFLVTGIDQFLFVRDIEKVSWVDLRNYVHQLIENNFSPDKTALAKALLMGYKEELPDQTVNAFARTGLSHAMAVSGMHVGFIVAPMWLLIPWFWRFRRGKELGFIGIGVMLLAYAGITGFSASVVRASLMAVLLAFGKLYHRRRNSINLTAVAALLLLWYDPRYLFDVGFQLSFAAVFTILLVWPVANRIWTGNRKHRWWYPLVQLFWLSLIVQLGLLPILAHYFGMVSLIGPLMNMLVMVVVGVLIQWSLLCVIISSFAPVWGQWFNIPADMGLEFVRQGVIFGGDLSWSGVAISGSHPLWFVLWALLLVAVGTINMPHHRWKVCILAGLTIFVWQAEELYRGWREGRHLKVTVLDVGQGDAFVVQTPQKKNILIDAGRWTPDYNSGSYVIKPYLKSEGIDTLHAVIFSHPHADHIGGMEYLIENLPIKKIYHSGNHYASDLYHRIMKRAKENKIRLKPVSAGDRLNLDTSIRTYILGPDKNEISSRDEVNNASVIVQITYGSQKFLFMGDAGRRQEEELVKAFGGKNNNLLASRFLKVGHHGSNTSSSEQFLREVRPDISVVSLAWENRYRHPHAGAVNRLYKWTKDTLLFTSRDKSIVFETNGVYLRRVNWEYQHF